MINRKQACIKLRPPPVMVADFSVDEPPQTQAASTENPMEMIMKMADVGESQKGGIPPRKSVPADQRADHLDDLDIPAHPALYVTSSGSVSHGNSTVNCNISLDPGSSGPSVSSVGPSGVGPSSVGPSSAGPSNVADAFWSNPNSAWEQQYFPYSMQYAPPFNSRSTTVPSPFSTPSTTLSPHSALLLCLHLLWLRRAPHSCCISSLAT